MPSSERRLEEVLFALPKEGITHRKMMGEYIIYYEGKVVGGIYDDRLLLKSTDPVRIMLPDAKMEIPYEGARPMILLDDLSDRILIKELIMMTWTDLYAKKPKKGYHR